MNDVEFPRHLLMSVFHRTLTVQNLFFSSSAFNQNKFSFDYTHEIYINTIFSLSKIFCLMMHYL